MKVFGILLQDNTAKLSAQELLAKNLTSNNQ